jgi:hypothetical protein
MLAERVEAHAPELRQRRTAEPPGCPGVLGTGSRRESARTYVLGQLAEDGSNRDAGVADTGQSAHPARSDADPLVRHTVMVLVRVIDQALRSADALAHQGAQRTGSARPGSGNPLVAELSDERDVLASHSTVVAAITR